MQSRAFCAAAHLRTIAGSEGVAEQFVRGWRPFG